MFAVCVYLRAGVGSGVGVVNGGRTKREIKEITGLEKQVIKLQLYFVDYLQRGLKVFLSAIVQIYAVKNSNTYSHRVSSVFLLQGYGVP